MLTLLTPSQISDRWEDLKAAILVSMPPYASITPETMNNILECLMGGSMQGWMLHEGDDNHAFATTRMEIDVSSGTKNLLIFSLYAYRFVAQELWTKGIAGLKLFAAESGCQNVIAFTMEPRVLELAKTLSADIDVHLLTWRV